MQFITHTHRKHRSAAVVGLLIAVVAGGAGYAYFRLYEVKTHLQGEVSDRELSITFLERDLRQKELENEDLAYNLQQERDTNGRLSFDLQQERARNSTFESQIQQIAGTVGTLKKLSETDKELLKKYSKVYFLSENYVPSALTQISEQYLRDKAKSQQFHANAAPFLFRMLAEATQNGRPMEIISAYRSFTDQISIKSTYTMLYGSGANQFSADQGYSEHQLGTAIDLVTTELEGLSDKFEQEPAYTWLTQNAHRFGFVLSYPKGNAYYEFEPWHWRFVGVQLATRLRSENKFFYDLSQRDIDAYLISIFD